MKNSVKCSRMNASQAWLSWLADILLWVTLSWAPLLHCYICKWLPTRRLYQGVQSNRIFQASPHVLRTGWQSVLSFIRLMAALQPFLVTFHSWADVTPWWLEVWVGTSTDRMSSLVGFVDVSAGKLSDGWFQEYFYTSCLNCPTAFCQRLFSCS